MLQSLLAIFLCQLAGEVVQRLTAIPVPGPVIGMALMFAALLSRGGVPKELDATSSGFLRCLSLLFVPAGVGIMTQGDFLAAQWFPVAGALVGSSVVAIAVTALTMERLERLQAREGAILGRSLRSEAVDGQSSPGLDPSLGHAAYWDRGHSRGL
jgi:holin-like protein